MDRSEIVQWLVDEARVSLEDFGPFPLYEFLWALDSSSHGLSPEQSRAAARQAAERLLDVANLCTLRWPKNEPVAGPLPISALDDDRSWENTEVYVALVPKAERT